jgi:ATP-dependent Zn protease
MRAARPFIEHCYQEAPALIDENKPVLLALAQALIDHPERTLTPPRSTR